MLPSIGSSGPPPTAPEFALTGGSPRPSSPSGKQEERFEARAGLGRETELSSADKKKLEELRRRDREVRAHEQAHKAAAGAHARGGPTYTYQLGPDNKRYAVGGEVGIDASEVSGDPQATIAKMQQVRRAALAPADPSAADRQIASDASRKQAHARNELRQEREQEASGAEAESSSRETTYGEHAHELKANLFSARV